MNPNPNPNGKYMDIDKAIDACTIIQRFWRSKNLILYRPCIIESYYRAQRNEYILMLWSCYLYFIFYMIFS